jgi:hypothetical protein
MHQQIKDLQEIINQIDNDPTKSMQYFTGACLTKTPLTKTVYNCRWLLIEECLHKIQHMLEQSDDCSIVDSHVNEIFDKLNDVYQKTQYNCWRSHDHHFHKTIEEYVNCPVTCLAEVGEFLGLMLKELYHT